MANQRDKNKRILGVYLERDTYLRLSKLAAEKKTTVADLTRMQIERIVQSVELSPEEKLKIKKDRIEFDKRQKAALAKKRTFQTRMQAMRDKLAP